jgi:small subunit ribosomal protein S4
MFKVKAKNKICRKYLQDIWGNLIRKKKITNVVIYLLKLKQEKGLRYKPFFLDVKIAKPLKKRKSRSRFSKNLDTIKKLSFFHGGLRKKLLKKYLLTSKKKKGIFVTNFLSLLELRLAAIIFRMNICYTILEANQLVYSGTVLVNKEVVKNINYIVSIGDIIEILPSERKKYYNFYKNLQGQKKLLCIQPHFLQINYEILTSIVIKKPDPIYIKYPFLVAKQFSYMLSTSKL